jgi:large conductance mechanosensitive channel
MFKEFKTFIMRGNVIDMAVGIIIGAAFGKIVSSLVADVLMPPLGMLIGRVDFANLFFVLNQGKVPGPYETLAAAQAAGAVTINIGVFINSVISFVIMAFAVFMLIRGINRLNRKQPEAPGPLTNKDCPHCLSSIDIRATRCSHCTSQLGPGALASAS